MKIKASEMERMFGLSPNGVRLYEKQGIIRPRRDGGGGYRVYGPEEAEAMGFGMQYRRYGFTMPQTATLMDDGQAQLCAMRERVDGMEAEIDRLMRVRKSLKTHVRRIELAQALMNRCEEAVKPAMYFLAARRGEKFVCARAHDMVGAWIERYAPHLSSAALLDGPFFARQGCEREPLRGVAVDAEVALELGLLPSEYQTYLPPKRCVVTGVRAEGEEADLKPVIARVRGYAQERGIDLHDGGMIRWVQCVREGERLALTGLLFVPLREDEASAGIMK